MEARIKEIVAGMTLAQKVGQMTQPEIKFITPEQVREVLHRLRAERRRQLAAR
jgi:ABC-type thiamine transport system substrate-binding protein